MLETLTNTAESFARSHIDFEEDVAWQALQGQKRAEIKLVRESQLVAQKHYSEAAVEVDPIATARMVASELVDSKLHKKLKNDLLAEAQTTLFEAASANTNDIFTYSLLFDPEISDFVQENGHRQLGDIAYKGISALSLKQAQRRQVAEYREFAICSEIAQNYERPTTLVFLSFPNPGESENPKIMMRVNTIQENPQGKLELQVQQLSYSATNITEQHVETFYEGFGLSAHDFISAMEQPLLFDGNIAVEDIGKSFDDLLGDGFVGGYKSDENRDNFYRTLRDSSEKRRQQLLDSSVELQKYIEELASSDVDPFEAIDSVRAYVEKILIDASMNDPAIAKAAFSNEVEFLVREGKYEEALEKAQAQYCGAGSCGLRTASAHSQALAVEHGVEKGDILENTEGHCKACGKRGYIMVIDRETQTIIKNICDDSSCPSNKQLEETQ